MPRSMGAARIPILNGNFIRPTVLEGVPLGANSRAGVPMLSMPVGTIEEALKS
jgi:hypothetical protein